MAAKRIAIVLAGFAVAAGISACGGSQQQSMTQRKAYRYGQVIGKTIFLTTMNQDGKGAAEALCQSETEGITSSFVPTADLVEFPQWKNSAAKGREGWFFMGVKAGCKA